MAKYRLQTLLEIREKEKKAKEEELAKAQQNLRMEQQKLEELRKQVQDMRDMRASKHQEFVEKTSTGELGIQGWVSAERYLKRVDKEIEEFEETEIKEQQKVIAFAEQEVEWAYEEMLEALQAYKALEKHKENWQEEYKKEMAAKEELKQEEIAQAIFTFRNK
jgi:flagellar export protein FliJ